jgi:hypothetical protein
MKNTLLAAIAVLILAGCHDGRGYGQHGIERRGYGYGYPGGGYQQPYTRSPYYGGGHPSFR